jgi:hypothetical protein
MIAQQVRDVSRSSLTCLGFRRRRPAFVLPCFCEKEKLINAIMSSPVSAIPLYDDDDRTTTPNKKPKPAAAAAASMIIAHPQQPDHEVIHYHAPAVWPNRASTTTTATTTTNTTAALKSDVGDNNDNVVEYECSICLEALDGGDTTSTATTTTDITP